MFTGIVAELGRVVDVDRGATASRLCVAGEILRGLRPGDSVAVNGVCLTAGVVAGGSITADVMAETLHRSALGDLTSGDPVNLELPVTLGTLLGGHLVQGHVDGVGTVRDRSLGDGWEVVEIQAPADLTRYLVTKGSIAVDGVSLTVVGVCDDWFTVSLIPETLRRTTLGRREPGSRVNLEIDLIAKYVEKLLRSQAEPLRGVTG